MQRPDSESSTSSTIVGVFDDQAKAERAIDELRKAGFQDDQIESVKRSVSTAEAGIPAGENIPAGEEDTREEELRTAQREISRIIVSVKAQGREQEALGVLFRNGADNANIPDELASNLTDTGLIPEEMATVDKTAPRSFFEEPIPPHAPGLPTAPAEPGIPEEPGSTEKDSTIDDPDLRLL